ncbi:MSP [Leishmania braziliensis]|nr:MSP [Leishmania braziliensis]
MDVHAPNVIINPEKFELVLHANEDCTFELTNVGYEAIIYRVRTTAPLRYYLKHSKGVVKGNSSAKITIFLNQKTFAEGLPVGARYTKDTFRVECAVLGERDVIEAHGANLASLIQKKKDGNAASVVQKYISCRVLLGGDSKDLATAPAAGKARAAGSGGAAASGDATGRGGGAAGADNGSSSRRSMTVEQMEQNTLNEKRCRNNSSGSWVAVRGNQTTLTRIVVAAVAVLLLAMWMMRGGVEDDMEEVME